MEKLQIDEEVRALLTREAKPAGRGAEAAPLELLDERPDGSAVGAADGLPLGRSDLAEPGAAVIVHNDHRVLVNYNASSQAARHRALTESVGERERGGGL